MKTPKLTPTQKKFVGKAQAAIAASSARTPSAVLKTFYPANIDLSGIKISKCGLGILGILEAIKHPFIEQALSGVEAKTSIADIQRALYIFAHPREAKSAIATGSLDAVVEAWVFDEEIPGDAVTKAPYVLIKLIQGEMAMIPGFDPHEIAAQPVKGAKDGPLDSPASPISPSGTQG